MTFSRWAFFLFPKSFFTINLMTKKLPSRRRNAEKQEKKHSVILKNLFFDSMLQHAVIACCSMLLYFA